VVCEFGVIPCTRFQISEYPFFRGSPPVAKVVKLSLVTFSRRTLLARAGTAAAAGAVAPFARAFPRGQSPNEKLVVALIGCGGHGAFNMRQLMRFADVEVAAVCDVDQRRIPGDVKAVTDKYGRAPQVVSDYRRLLDRKDIDAVLIGTPDHWHALQQIHAAQAGKDAFTEKPISHNLVEAMAMDRAVKRHQRVVQVGTWQRSTREFTDAIDYVRSGRLGRVTQVRCWITDGFRAGKQADQTPPAELDYDAWIGPAEMIPYRPNRIHWNWRWFWNYGGGMTTDWGVHMMDIGLLGISAGQDLRMPTRVSATGGNWAIADDDRTAPDTTEAIYTFTDPDVFMTWSVRQSAPGLPGQGTEWVGADGRVVRVWRGGWQVLAPDGKNLEKPEFAPPPDHWRDWVDCVKSRGVPRASLASVAQSTIVCHLANIALLSGETVHWDNAKQDLKGRTGRDTLAYRRPYRKPYVLPERFS